MGFIKKRGHYKFVIETNNVVLTYEAIVIDIDDMFVTFIDDKYKKIYTFNLNKVVSIEEVDNDRNSKTSI